MGCSSSLLCLMGKLEVRLFCAVCDLLVLWNGQKIVCANANRPGVMLSVCNECKQAFHRDVRMHIEGRQ